LTLESERFSQLVLRLFHTELEAVYEEFNRSQDVDFRKLSYALNDALFPTHPYGQQKTIGNSEHLKNPSMKAIHNYFETYYVPNNMAVVLVGDIEFEETIKQVNEAFRSFDYKEVNHPIRPTAESITNPIVVEVTGTESANLNLAFRTAKEGSEQEKIVKLVSLMFATI